MLDRVRGLGRGPLPFVVLLGSIWGSSLVVSRFGLGQFEPRTFVSLRLIMAAIAHLLIYAFSRSRTPPRDLGLWLKAGFLGVFSTALVMASIVSSLQYMSSGVSSLLLTLNPVLVVFLAHFLLKGERLTWPKLLGAMIALLGAGMLLLRGETGLEALGQADWRGYAWAGLGLVAGASGSIFAHRQLRTARGFDVASIRMFFASLALIPVVALSGGYDLTAVTWTGYVALVYGGLVGGFGAFLLSFYVLKRFGAPANAMAIYVVPVVTTTLGVLFLDEQVTPFILVSMALVLAGVWLLNRRTAA